MGTAGHVDHGKTELIKALTGVDTDRLPEEKERAISIDLGFASLDLGDGIRLGIVDVPGHERFVKNMLAGAGGIDLVLLVIAADEGVMPQTTEHLNIVELLGVSRGVIAITKSDLVDEEWIDLVKSDVGKLIGSTPLGNAPVVTVSSRTGEGMEDLKVALSDVARSVQARGTSGPTRLPVDRVFSVAGYGTVVTGTMWSGSVSEGDRMIVLPAGRETRVRKVEVHGKEVDRGRAGERIALSLHGVSKDEISRGDNVITPGSLGAWYVLDAKARLVRGADAIKNSTRVRFHLATSEVMGRIYVFGRDKLSGDGEAYVQLRLEAPVVCDYRDRFVIRSYSPQVTIAGGTVLLPGAPKRKRLEKESLELLETMEVGEPMERIEKLISFWPGRVLSFEDIVKRSGLTETQTRKILDDLIVSAKCIEARGNYFHRTTASAAEKTMFGLLEDFKGRNPLKWGMGKEEIIEKMEKMYDRQLLEHVIEASSSITSEKGLVRAGGGEMELTEEDKTLRDKVEKLLHQAGASPPAVKAMAEELGDRRLADILGMLERDGTISKISSDLYFHFEVIAEMKAGLSEFFATKDDLSVPEFKELARVSRKHAIPLLEYFDSKGVTTRAGDNRKKGPELRE
jgi:selenocysteine-specific elongation factor